MATSMSGDLNADSVGPTSNPIRAEIVSLVPFPGRTGVLPLALTATDFPELGLTSAPRQSITLGIVTGRQRRTGTPPRCSQMVRSLTTPLGGSATARAPGLNCGRQTTSPERCTYRADIQVATANLFVRRARFLVRLIRQLS